MIRLNEPSYSFEQSLDDCVSDIAAYMPLRSKMGNAKGALLKAGDGYSDASRRGRLFEIAPFLGDAAEIVIAAMTKAELVKIYDQYFVPEGKIARRVYDSILSSSLEKCPFCGGIGTPRNIDHFLPKSLFPQFSVLPYNLVPACRDCNMDGKADAFARSADSQPIQPYLEASRFFDEQWVYASYYVDRLDAPGRFEYFVSAPNEWEDVDKKRVESHFSNFDLARRYSVKAAEHVATVHAQMQKMRAVGLSEETIKTVLLKPGVDRAPFINHWQRAMYQALM